MVGDPEIITEWRVFQSLSASVRRPVVPDPIKNTMAAWTTGHPLGPYVLLAASGAGGMGEVWKARDTRLDRIVAVKRLKGPYSARFEQEARAIAALNHPHICQIHDIGPDYLVLEYVEGQPLKGPLALEEAVRLAVPIAEGLAP